MTPAHGRIALGGALALAMSALLAGAFSRPFSLAEFCTRNHPTWVFGLFETPRYTALTGQTFLAALAGLAALYLGGLWVGGRLAGRVAIGVLLVAAPLLFAGVLLPGYPLLSNDIFKYVFDGRILAVYHENPFVRVPADHPEDRFYDLVYWKAVVNAHGPIWRGLEAASAGVGGEGCVNAVVAMKLWPTLAYAGTIGALFLLQRSLPATAMFATLAYAWNPLVILEALQNGHNDVVAALPALLAIWAGQAGRWRLAFPLLALGFLVKPLAAILGPVLLVAAWRAGPRERRDALVGMGIGAVLVTIAYVPFFNGLATFQGLERSDLFSASPAELLMIGLGEAGWPLADAMAASRAGTTLAFLALAALVLVGVWRRQVSLGAGAAATLLAYLLIGAQWFNPWYLLWLIPIALATSEPRLWRVAILFSLLAPMTYLLQYDGRLIVPLVFLPTIGLALVWWVLPSWHRSAAPTAPTSVASPHVVGRG
jgi:alpha-1,6-mannosyltransferase